MLLRLKSEMRSLLIEVVEKHRPDLLSLVSMNLIELTEIERDEVLDAVVDEFTATGLASNDEPNERGIHLDNLIGILALIE